MIKNSFISYAKPHVHTRDELTTASATATTLFLRMRVPAIVAKYRSVLAIPGMVAFIAAYHYIGIFNMVAMLFLWMRVLATLAQYRAALITSGMMPFISVYHCIDIFNNHTK